MLNTWPGLIQLSPTDMELHLGPARNIGHHIDSDRYWQIVEQNQTP